MYTGFAPAGRGDQRNEKTLRPADLLVPPQCGAKVASCPFRNLTLSGPALSAAAIIAPRGRNLEAAGDSH